MLKDALRPLKNRLRSPYRKFSRGYTRWRHGFGPADFLKLLRDTGVNPGDAIFVHSSMTGFEGLRGTVQDVVTTLEESVGPEGTVLMPALSMGGTAVEYAESGKVFDPKTTPSRVGMLTEIFRRSPDVERSLHPTHSVCAWGADRAWWLKDHQLADSPCGRGTPFARLWERGGKMIFAGVDIACMTFFHYAEEVLEPQMPFSPFTTERYTMRYRAGGEIRETIPMRLYAPAISRRRRLQPLADELKRKKRWKEGKTGTLQIIVLDARETLDTLCEMAARGTYCYAPQ